MHDENSFITLTYNNENLPYGGTLIKKHLTDFFKRLRKQHEPKKLRYFACGEYGDKMDRPHYHALLFGKHFDDYQTFVNEEGKQYKTSPSLEITWPHGFNTIGEITFQSAAYCAKYTTKKRTGHIANTHYERLIEETGETIMLEPEYGVMSRGGKTGKGLGYEWYQKYKTDLFPRDECIVDGRIMKPPKYYTKIYEKEEPEQWNKIKQDRRRFSDKHEQDNTSQRLGQRETVKQAQTKQTKRKYENES